MGEYSLRLYQINLPRLIYKKLSPSFTFKFVKTRKPFRYSLLQVGYAVLSTYSSIHHVSGNLSNYFFEFGWVLTSGSHHLIK